MSKKGQTFSNTRLFTPSVIRNISSLTTMTEFSNAAFLSSSIQDSTASFSFDAPGSGIKNTQQIPLDWSKFENHTFFNSAESKVNVSFDNIINRFPFDGTRDEYIEFFNGLTGYEKYIYDAFPKYTGYLNFLGSSVAAEEQGTFIEVKDVQGSLYPALSRNRKETNVIDPGSKSFTTEMQLYLPGIANGNQVIFQKYNAVNKHGITLALSASDSATSGSIHMFVTSGSSVLSSSMTVEKEKFNHICCTWNRIPSKNKIQMWRNAELMSESPNSNRIGLLTFNDNSVLIGSGSRHAVKDYNTDEQFFTPSETLSGSIDELRVWHAIRKQKLQQKYQTQVLYSEKNLVLYYKFNEPTGSHSGNDIVLDSSGNSLHSNVSNYAESMRITGSNSSLMSPGLTSPMVQEGEKFSPILFPGQHKLLDLNTNLLNSASTYDANNPNLITKLIPRHYLLEATYFEGFENEEANIGDAISTITAFPGGAKIGSGQIISSILFTWAKFFDEMKVYLDQLGNVLNVDYVDDNVVADQFLPFLANHYGFDLPNMFSDASIAQYTSGEHLTVDKAISQHPLQYIQNQIWRRILTDIVEIVRTKGTVRSIKAAFLNMGINPKKGFRFREFGGQRLRLLSDVREERERTTRMLVFTGSLKRQLSPEDVDAQGVHSDRPFLRTNFLSASRVEPGIPFIAGNNSTQEVHPTTGSNNASDGLLTSGSFTYEALYRFNLANLSTRPISQSLARLVTTGALVTNEAQPMNHLFANLVAVSPQAELSTTGSVQFYANPSVTSSYSQESSAESKGVLHLLLTGVNIFDGNIWNVSFGRVRSDFTGSINSSSYFLRAGRQNNGKITDYFYTEKYFDDHHSTNFFETIDRHHNASGSFVVVGSQSLSSMETITSSVGLANSIYNSGHPSDLDGLESNTDFNHPAWTTNFDGEVGHMRFFTKLLTIKEHREHVHNFNSLGVSDPIKNFSFNTTDSGSFERLRMNLETEQEITSSDSSGNIEIIDFTQNGFFASGSGFEVNKEVCAAHRILYTQLTTHIDEPATNKKIRARSFKDREKAKFRGTRVAPVHELDPKEQILDDPRFSIEVSSVQALNDDIVNILSTLNSLDNMIGRPELMFSPDYPDLENLREIYFNRLTDKLNIKTFFDFFRWFDTSMGTIIERLVPRKTQFLGVNFVVEPHMLERAKFHYNNADIYLGENDRQSGRESLLVQQVLGQIRKY